MEIRRGQRSSGLKIVSLRVQVPERVVQADFSRRFPLQVKSRRPVGRPPADADLRGLIRQFGKEHPLWGEDKIAPEIGRLGYKVLPRSVPKHGPPNLPLTRGQSWSTFLQNHVHQTWACDFLTIHHLTLSDPILYCFVIVDLAQREILHVGVTSSPSAQYARQCFVEAVADRDNESPWLFDPRS